MLKVYLFIELLGSADANAVLGRLEALKIANGTLRNAVALAEDKLVAHVDCETGADATRAVLEGIMSIDGIVQANPIAVVRPRNA